MANLSAGLPTDVRVLGHGRLSEVALVHGPGVARKFRKARVASNRADLMCGATGLGQAASSGLAQTVSGAVRQARLIALFAEPTAKGSPLERPAVPSCHEGKVLARRGCNDGC